MNAILYLNVENDGYPAKNSSAEQNGIIWYDMKEGRGVKYHINFGNIDEDIVAYFSMEYARIFSQYAVCSMQYAVCSMHTCILAYSILG